MRILITGFAVFVVWCFISAWLYNDILLPAMKKPEPVTAIIPLQSTVADSLAKLKAAMPETLQVYFEFNKAEFKPDQQTDNGLAVFKSWLDKYQGSMLYISGHSDLVGTEEMNRKLGLERAQAVQKYAEGKGIPASRIIAESKGESQPAADYLTEEGRAKSRRTEISIKMQ
jgi:OmpA-OmpF porin, OOP family